TGAAPGVGQKAPIGGFCPSDCWSAGHPSAEKKTKLVRLVNRMEANERKRTRKPRFALVVEVAEPIDDAATVRRLRWTLKRLLRGFGWRCTAIRPEPAEPTDEAHQ